MAEDRAGGAGKCKLLSYALAVQAVMALIVLPLPAGWIVAVALLASAFALPCVLWLTRRWRREPNFPEPAKVEEMHVGILWEQQ